MNSLSVILFHTLEKQFDKIYSSRQNYILRQNCYNGDILIIVHEEVEVTIVKLKGGKKRVKSHCHGNLFGRMSLATAYFLRSPGSRVNCEYNNVIMHLTNTGGVM